MLPRASAGFTLIEMLIALAIGSVLLASVYTFYINQKRLYDMREQVAEMQQNARAGIALMVRDIRMAGYNPLGVPGIGIRTATADMLRITMDLNGDGDTDDANEDITYALYDSADDGDLDLGRQAAGGQNTPVAENIVRLNFVYTLANGATTSTPPTPGHIRLIQTTLTAQVGRPDARYGPHGGYRTYTLTSAIRLRNAPQ
jgi:type IV pilus assembly protein PilW